MKLAFVLDFFVTFFIKKKSNKNNLLNKISRVFIIFTKALLINFKIFDFALLQGTKQSTCNNTFCGDCFVPRNDELNKGLSMILKNRYNIYITNELFLIQQIKRHTR